MTHFKRFTLTFDKIYNFLFFRLFIGIDFLTLSLLAKLTFLHLSHTFLFILRLLSFRSVNLKSIKCRPLSVCTDVFLYIQPLSCHPCVIAFIRRLTGQSGLFTVKLDITQQQHRQYWAKKNNTTIGVK